MDSTTLTRQVKLERWAEIIRDRNESGLTISQWCKKNSINEAKYYYWLKRVRQAACDDLPAIARPTGPIVQITMDEQGTPANGYDDKAYAMRMTVNGVALEFTNDASASLIENVLRVLRYAR